MNADRNVSALANETFAQLDPEETDRLARRAFTEEWRAALRTAGYVAIEIRDDAGDISHVYRHPSRFAVDDYDLWISEHIREAHVHSAVIPA